MKLYDRNGNFVGTVRKEELVKAEDAIMPVPITIKPARKLSFPSGYTVMGVGSVLAAIATVLSYGGLWISDMLNVFLFMSGLLSEASEVIFPLSALLWLFGSVLLMFEHKIYALPAVYFLISVFWEGSVGVYAVCGLIAYILLSVILIVFRKSKSAYMLIASRVLLFVLMTLSWMQSVVVTILMLICYLVEVLYFFKFAHDDGKAVKK